MNKEEKRMYNREKNAEYRNANRDRINQRRRELYAQKKLMLPPKPKKEKKTADMKAYKRDYNKKYMELYRERILAKRRLYYRLHREEILAKEKEERRKKREERIAKEPKSAKAKKRRYLRYDIECSEPISIDRRYYLNHRDKVLERCRQYRERNRETINAKRKLRYYTQERTA